MKSLYFPHDSNAHEDMRIIELRMQYGWEAYGLFWALLEVMRIADDYSIDCAIKPLAFKFQVKPEKLQKIIERCLELKLLTKEDNILYCKELNERMKAVEAKSANAKKAAAHRWGNADAMQTHSNRNANKVKKSKINKSKVNTIKENILKEKKSGLIKFANKDHLFKDSPMYDFKTFKKEFLGTKYENADLEFYYEAVKNWADSKGVKRKDWLATARNFILRDFKENKLRLKDGTKPYTDEQAAVEYWQQRSV